MSAFMAKARLSRDDVSEVVRAERAAALRNPRATYGGMFTSEEVGSSEPIAAPLRRHDRAEYADGGVVVILASEKWIRKNRREAVYVDALEWRSSVPWYEGGGLAKPGYAADSFAAVLKKTGRRGLRAFDVLEVDDTYSYKLVQHLMAMGATRAEALGMVAGKGPAVNPSGGALGCGNLLEAAGLHKVLECVLQLRGTAGPCQVPKARTAAALSWRGTPTASGAAIALSRGS